MCPCLIAFVSPRSRSYVVGGDHGHSAPQEKVQSLAMPCPPGRYGPDCKQCLHEAGYFGPDCTPCDGVVPNMCNAPCFGHGTCDMGDPLAFPGATGGGACACDTGYAPPDCRTCQVNLAGPDCAQCAEGFFGPDCKPCAGPPGHPCNGHGVCNGTGSHSGTGQCQCELGWAGNGCEECAAGHAGPECATCPGYIPTLGVACNAHGVCAGAGSTNGSGVCVCDSSTPWTGPECCAYDECPAHAPLFVFGLLVCVVGALLLVYLFVNRGSRAVLVLFLPHLHIIAM